MLRHAVIPSPSAATGTTTTVTTLISMTERQAVLGDDQAASDRRLLLQEQVSAILVPYGDANPTKTKHVLDFTKNLQYKKR